jgi:hypothetical protein
MAHNIRITIHEYSTGIYYAVAIGIGAKAENSLSIHSEITYIIKGYTFK